MKIEVTEQDIKLGRRCSRDRCPVALAFKRAGIKPDGVTGMAVVFFYKTSYTEVTLPSKVANFIADFDNSVVVEPFSFDLDLPDYATTLVQPPA